MLLFFPNIAVILISILKYQNRHKTLCHFSIKHLNYYICTMSIEIHNIHDKFVRETFSDPGRAIAFFERFLPKSLTDQIDLSGLRVTNESYITQELKEYFSDLVFEVNTIGEPDQKMDVVLLFEHKSFPDNQVLIQIGHYMFAQLYKFIQKAQPPKPIIPIIYYQGDQNWQAPSLKSLFGTYPEAVRKYVPDLNHIFIALSKLTDSQITSVRSGLLAAALTVQKLKANPTQLNEDLNKIFRLFPITEQDGNFLFTIFIYTIEVSDITEEQLASNLQEIPKELKDNIMSTYTRILERVKSEGEQIGIQKKERDFVLSSFDNGLDISVICSITELDEKKVMAILKEHGRV